MVGARQFARNLGKVETLVTVHCFEANVLGHALAFEAGDCEQRFDAASSAQSMAGLALAAECRRGLVGELGPGVAEADRFALVVGARASCMQVQQVDVGHGQPRVRDGALGGEVNAEAFVVRASDVAGVVGAGVASHADADRIAFVGRQHDRGRAVTERYPASFAIERSAALGIEGAHATKALDDELIDDVHGEHQHQVAFASGDAAGGRRDANDTGGAGHRQRRWWQAKFQVVAQLARQEHWRAEATAFAADAGHVRLGGGQNHAHALAVGIAGFGKRLFGCKQ